jgi:hypothetical protein
MSFKQWRLLYRGGHIPPQVKVCSIPQLACLTYYLSWCPYSSHLHTVDGESQAYSWPVMGDFNPCFETTKRNCLYVKVLYKTYISNWSNYTSVSNCWYIKYTCLYIVLVARIPVFISDETASNEFSEERPPLFCTTHLLNVELSPNGASRMRDTSDRL